MYLLHVNVLIVIPLILKLIMLNYDFLSEIISHIQFLPFVEAF